MRKRIINNFNFYKSLRYYIVVCLLFLSCNKAYTQENASRNNIIIAHGVELYSTEENFNRQILANNNLVNTSKIIYQELSGNKQLIIIAHKSAKKKNADFKDQLQEVKNKRQKKVLKQLKDAIDQYEKKTNSFNDYNFNNQSSEQSFSSSVISKSYVTSSQRNYDYSKYLSLGSAYQITASLDFLHFQKFRYYNNKSLDFCFSEIFSVRPPPTNFKKDAVILSYISVQILKAVKTLS